MCKELNVYMRGRGVFKPELREEEGMILEWLFRNFVPGFFVGHIPQKGSDNRVVFMCANVVFSISRLMMVFSAATGPPVGKSHTSKIPHEGDIVQSERTLMEQCCLGVNGEWTEARYCIYYTYTQKDGTRSCATWNCKRHTCCLAASRKRGTTNVVTHKKKPQ